MRIIRGKYQGRRFNAPKSIKARPTTDFAKESLFNILENRIDIDEIKVLDLFAGTGNISIEFASRGASSVTSIDIAFQSVKYINQMANELDLPIRAYKNNVFKFLSAPTGNYDIVFADPPYALKGIEKIPGLVLNSNLLESGGILVVEHGQETDLSNCDHFIEKRTYSRVNFSFFEKP